MVDWIQKKIKRERGKQSNTLTETEVYTHTHTLRHSYRYTHHPQVSALCSCVRPCWGRPQACDCVRGGIWVANSIWSEDPILRCQYSPHYQCILLIQGGVGEHTWNKNGQLWKRWNAHQEATKCGTNKHLWQIMDNNRGQHFRTFNCVKVRGSTYTWGDPKQCRYRT